MVFFLKEVDLGEPVKDDSDNDEVIALIPSRKMHEALVVVVVTYLTRTHLFTPEHTCSHLNTPVHT